jgi:hypothetical protein
MLYIFDRRSFLGMKNISDDLVKRLETQFLCSKTFFSPENRAVCKIMWKDTVDRDRPHVTIRACALHAGYLRLEIHTQAV